MALKIGVKVFGVRGGVRVGTKGIGYGVGAGPLKATGGRDFNSDSGLVHPPEDVTFIIGAIFSGVVCSIIGLGVLIAFIPLVAASIFLFVPYRSKRLRVAALCSATLVFCVVTRSGWRYFSDHFWVNAKNPDYSDFYSVGVVIVLTGLIFGIIGSTFFFLYSVFRGKHLYDKIYLRPEE